MSSVDLQAPFPSGVGTSLVHYISQMASHGIEKATIVWWMVRDQEWRTTLLHGVCHQCGVKVGHPSLWLHSPFWTQIWWYHHTSTIGEAQGPLADSITSCYNILSNSSLTCGRCWTAYRLLDGFCIPCIDPVLDQVGTTQIFCPSGYYVWKFLEQFILERLSATSFCIASLALSLVVLVSGLICAGVLSLLSGHSCPTFSAWQIVLGAEGFSTHWDLGRL